MKRSDPPCKQRGATLIEILVSMIILSLGMLGYAGLILKSHSAGNSSAQRSQATIIANNIMESARANKANAASYECPTPCNDSADITGTTLADNDMKMFANHVAELPGGSAIIDYNNTDKKLSITISWTNTSDVNDITSFTTETSIQ